MHPGDSGPVKFGLLVLKEKPEENGNGDESTRTTYGARRSGRAKEIGDNAEKVVPEWLRGKVGSESGRQDIV